jgi:hypothetical protein
MGMRFSLVEIKTFLYILLTSFEFATTEERIVKSNVYVSFDFCACVLMDCRALTRPYVAKKFVEGSQLPLLVKPYIMTPNVVHNIIS